MSPTPLASTPPDDDLEARLRSAFAARADEVRLADLDPDLPSGVRISLDDPTDHGRPGRNRARWVAVAAAVALVGAGIGLAASVGDDGTTTTATTPESTTTTAPRAEVFASFPAGVDPAVGGPLFVTSVHSGPEEAMAEALARLGGEGATAPMPTDLGLGSDTWDSFYSPTGAVDADLWGAAADLDERGGVVVARPAAGGGWGVVAVTSRVIDMRGLVRQGDRLSGEVRAPVGAPLRVVVTRARSDGRAPTEEDGILTSDLTTQPDSGLDGSVLAIGDDLDGGPVDVGTGPIVVRVEVGSAPGQVGEAGVEVAALASVGIPGPGGAGPDDGAAGATTTAPTTAGPSSPGGPSQDDVLWQPSVDAEVEDDPVEVAGLFVFEVLGEKPAAVGRPGASAPAASSTVPGPEPGTARVLVALASGADLPVVLGRVDGRWAVTQVGDGGVEASTEGGATSVSGAPPGGGEESSLWVALRRDPGTGRWTVERGRLPDEPVSFEGADAAVAVVVNDLGQVVAANGNAQ